MAYVRNNSSYAILLNQALARRNERYTIAFQLSERHPTILPATFSLTSYVDTYQHVATMALAGDVLSQRVLVFTSEVEGQYIERHPDNACLMPLLSLVKMQPWFCKEVLQDDP